MATQVLTNCKIWLDQFNLSADMNAVALNTSADIHDMTVFGDTSRRRVGGLKDTKASASGFWNDAAAGVDKIAFDRVGLNGIDLSIAPMTGAEGELAYIVQVAEPNYSVSDGGIGTPLEFSLDLEGIDEIVRGIVGHNATRTASGNGSAYNMGNVGAAQKLYASLHVLSVSGTTPSMVAKVQSSIDGFTTPVDRITFTAATTPSAQYSTLVGPITATGWRVNFTITGTSPSFTFVLTMGIK